MPHPILAAPSLSTRLRPSPVGVAGLVGAAEASWRSDLVLQRCPHAGSSPPTMLGGVGARRGGQVSRPHPCTLQRLLLELGAPLDLSSSSGGMIVRLCIQEVVQEGKVCSELQLWRLRPGSRPEGQKVCRGLEA